MAYASGKRALGICDRTGVTYKLSDLVWEVQNGVKTGFRVGKDVVDPDQPQNFLGRVKINDPQALLNPRPDFAPGNGLWGWNPIWNNAQYMVGSVGIVIVTTTGMEYKMALALGLLLRVQKISLKMLSKDMLNLVSML
jgi:hypothetical protein